MKGLEGGMTVKKAWQDENQGEKDPFKMKRKKKKRRRKKLCEQEKPSVQVTEA